MVNWQKLEDHNFEQHAETVETAKLGKNWQTVSKKIGHKLHNAAKGEMATTLQTYQV